MTRPDHAVTMPYRVPYADTDKMGIVYYANYLEYFERQRNELFRDSVISYDALEKSGIFLPVVEAHAEYESPARYDDLIQVTGWVAWIQGSRIRIEYEVTLGDRTLARGHTIHTAVNAEGNPRRIPAELINQYGRGNPPPVE